MKKTLLWAYIIKAYFISSLVFATVFLALWGEHARKLYWSLERDYCEQCDIRL